MPERLIMRVISMIDEMMTLLESVQDGEVNKKAHYIKSFDEKDDEQARLLHQLRQHQVTVRLEKERIKVELIPLQCLCQVQMLKR